MIKQAYKFLKCGSFRSCFHPTVMQILSKCLKLERFWTDNQPLHESPTSLIGILLTCFVFLSFLLLFLEIHKEETTMKMTDWKWKGKLYQKENTHGWLTKYLRKKIMFYHTQFPLHMLTNQCIRSLMVGILPLHFPLHSSTNVSQPFSESRFWPPPAGL